MAGQELITAARLREVLHYNPKTGVFTWRVRTCNRVKVGDVAGSPHPEGYLRIQIDGRQYLAHRLSRLHTTGKWPPDEIDHLYGNKSDNRPHRLRLATRSENEHNKGLRKDNTSGTKCVVWHIGRRKWQANIRINGRRIHLGLFANPVHAWIVYRRAALKFHGHFAPGALTEDPAILWLMGARRSPDGRIEPVG